MKRDAMILRDILEYKFHFIARPNRLGFRKYINTIILSWRSVLFCKTLWWSIAKNWGRLFEGKP